MNFLNSTLTKMLKCNNNWGIKYLLVDVEFIICKNHKKFKKCLTED